MGSAPERLELEIRKERKQLENLVAAIAAGQAPEAVLERIRTLEAAIAAKEAQMGWQSKRPPRPTGSACGGRYGSGSAGSRT